MKFTFDRLSGNKALVRLAPSKLAPSKFALERSTCDRLVCDKFTIEKFMLPKTAFCKSDPSKFAILNDSCDTSTSIIFAFLNNASFKCESLKSHDMMDVELKFALSKIVFERFVLYK